MKLVIITVLCEEEQAQHLTEVAAAGLRRVPGVDSVATSIQNPDEPVRVVVKTGG